MKDQEPRTEAQGETPGAVPVAPRAARSAAWAALPLAAAVVALLLLDNWVYLFHATLFENSDWASNSLFVREAKHGFLSHGHYSRWDFYHPGPALFYVLAAGEAVFHDWLHAVPTPFNGQVVALLAALALFFGWTLAVFARQLGARRGAYTFFWPLALLFAVWHYGAVNGASVFLETWPVCPPILVFLALLAGAAAVGAGGGGELPLLAGAGGWLLHNYVAQPLFVLPLWLLAYGGLLWQSRRREKQAGTSGRGALGWLGAGWRGHRGAHLLAGALLLLFALPLVADALRGDRSNLHSILAHLRRSHEPLKKFSRSLCYFLTFGGYDSYDPALTYFGRYSAAGMLAFAQLHWRAYLGWAAALAATPTLFLAARRGVPAAGDARPAARSEGVVFLPWFFGVLAVACVLTLLWGMKQEGEMFYFNAYFNYSIYYGALLGLAAALAVFLHGLTAGRERAGARTLLSAALWLGLAAAAANGAGRFRAVTLDQPENRDAARTIAAAAATVPPGAVCYVDCDPWEAWTVTIGAVLQLDRAGVRVRVNPNWRTMFGANRVMAHDPADLARPVARWRVLPVARDPARLGRWPLQGGYGIEIRPTAALDPAGGRIAFTARGNFEDYAVFGWSPQPGDWNYSDATAALLVFRPLPLPEGTPDSGGVDLLLSGWSVPLGYKEAPRVELAFNGAALGEVRLPPFAPDLAPLRVRIGARAWREAAAAGDGRIVFRFPDARSPESQGLGPDTRLLGACFRELAFEVGR